MVREIVKLFNPDIIHISLPITTRKLFSNIISPRGLFLGGLLFLIVGICSNYFFGSRDELILEVGKWNSPLSENHLSEAPEQKKENPGFVFTLDSLKVQPHTPVYELKLWKRDTASPQSQYGVHSKKLIGDFSLELMKIRKVEKTDLYFRLKDFYPNFEFAYEYPSDRDSIKPLAPGITLELKTTEGTSIVTLLSDQPKKQTLGDIVSLGAPLTFYWVISSDSIRALARVQEKSLNKIVFSGSENKVFFILNGVINEQPLIEKTFYKMPGKDTIGFTIIHCFPDAAFLKAVPSSRGTELRNPVAHVEIWKLGEGSHDAFVYPETNVRKGGQFEIPGSLYSLGLGLDQEKMVKYCDCNISFKKEGSNKVEKRSFVSGNRKTFHGYQFKLMECTEEFPGKVKMQVIRNPGKNLVIIGLTLGVVALLLQWKGKKQTQKHDTV